MTVPVPGSLTYSYDEDGVTTVFPYPVRFLEPQELVVIREAAGVQTVLAYNMDYTVSGAGHPSGGSITRTAVTNGGKIVITRDTAWKQIVDLDDKARNPAEAVELQMDRLTMAGQDIARRVDVVEVQTTSIDDAVRRSEDAAEAAGQSAEAAEAAQLAAESAAGANLSNADSVAAARLINIPGSVNYIRTAGYAVPGDGRAELYNRALTEPAHAGKFQSSDGAWWEDPFYADYTVRIPSDFPTLQAAVDALSRQPVRNGAHIILSIEAGHQLTHGLMVQNGDYSRFWIVSEAPAVAITGITQADPAIVTSGGHGLADGQHVYIDGIKGMTEVNRTVYIINNATTDTFELLMGDGNPVDSTGFAAYSGGGEIAVPVTLAASFEGVSDVGLAGENNNNGGNIIAGYNAAMPVLACLIDAGHNIHSGRGSGYYGIWAASGHVLPGCGVIRSSHDGLEMRASFCAAFRSVWSLANQSGIRAAQGANVPAQQARADDCMLDSVDGVSAGAIDVSRASTVFFRRGHARRSGGAGVNLRRASTFVGEQAVLDDATFAGLVAQGGSQFSCYGMSAQRCSGTGVGGTGYGAWIHSGASGTLMGSNFADCAAEVDIRVSDSGAGASAAGVVDCTDVILTGGVNNINRINVPFWNTVDVRGLALNFSATTLGSGGSPLIGTGTFSPTGATSGKQFNGSVLDSSRAGGSTQAHQRFYNTSGLVGVINTVGTFMHFQISEAGHTFSIGTGTPEGAITAPVGSIRLRTNGGAGATLYVKESGTGNTGWVAK